MATAEEGNGGEPPGLGRRRRPRFRPTDMAGGGVVGGKEDGGRETQLYILALPTAALPAVVISRLDAAVPRKARTCLPRAVPSAWWSGRISFLPPPPAAQDQAKEEEGRRFPRPQRVRVAPSLDLGAAEVGGGGEKPAKRLRKCLHCGKKEMRRGTLCNACSHPGALPECRPAASPILDSPLENPIWEPEVPGAIYLVRKSAAERRPHTHRAEAAPAPRPGTRCLHCGSSELPLWIEGPTGRREVCAACGMRYKKGRLLPDCPPAARPIINSPPESRIWEPEVPPPSVHLPKKSAAPSWRLPKKISKKKKKKHKGPAPWPKDKGKTCLHCRTSETPQWREGPKGRGTLCNACGVRYKQGGLLPEYRPAASPTFLPSKHANMRRKVLQLHRNREDLSPPAPVDSFMNLPPIRDNRPADTAGHAVEDPASAPGCTDKPIDVPSSLDSLLLDGPSAPLIVESDDFLIS
ncbi:hypothetical protein ACQ4PT_032481 [Festuca glaucescens]